MTDNAVATPVRERVNPTSRFHLTSVPGIPAVGEPGRGVTSDTLPVTLALTANDRLTEEGAQAWLGSTAGVSVVPWEERSSADIGVVLTRTVSLATLRLIEDGADADRGQCLPVLLVTDAISERHLMYAVERGVVGVMLRDEVGYADIVRAGRRALRGESTLPPTLVRALIERLRTLPGQQPGSAELSTRELDVLRLLAEGQSTVEVAGSLNYSERTIKNVLHDMITRLRLRNRTHAVAYAIRNGAL